MQMEEVSLSGSSWLPADGRGVMISLAVIVVLRLVYVFKFERLKQMRDKIPGFVDWPVVGDALHMSRDPVGKYLFPFNYSLQSSHTYRLVCTYKRQGLISLCYIFACRSFC